MGQGELWLADDSVGGRAQVEIPRPLQVNLSRWLKLYRQFRICQRKPGSRKIALLSHSPRAYRSGNLSGINFWTWSYNVLTFTAADTTFVTCASRFPNI